MQDVMVNFLIAGQGSSRPSLLGFLLGNEMCGPISKWAILMNPLIEEWPPRSKASMMSINDGPNSLVAFHY